MAGLVEHQVPVRKTVVVHVRGGEFLLVLVDLVQLRAHLPVRMASAHLASEDVSALGGCSLRPLLVACHAASWTARTGARSLPLDLRHHLHLVRILHYELACVASVGSANAA